MRKLKPLTHQEAVNRCYELTPQLREYDEFMYLGVRWVPYTMFFHSTNYRSDVLNTDGMGFRLSWSPRGTVSLEDFPKDTPINILVGGSTAMGTGTTRDEHTVASTLSKLTGEVWLNFGARGYNAVQELVLFLMHQHNFNNINNIVILSGLNTLTLEGLPDDVSNENGRYYYSYEFNHYMNKYNKDLKLKANGYASAADKAPSIFKRIKQRLEDWADSENHAEKIFLDEHVNINERIERAAKVTSKAVAQFKLLSAQNSAKVSFVLQPLSTWTKDKFHPEEEEMFHAIDACANNFWRLFEKLCTPSLHKTYAELIANDCDRIGVKFSDMNELMKTSKVLEDNIYVDHLHFNDAGYIEVARLIKEHVLTY